MAAIKVVITSWQGSNWACVADISAKQGSAPARDPYDVNGDGMVSIADVSTLLDYLSGAISLEDGVGDIDKDYLVEKTVLLVSDGKITEDDAAEVAAVLEPVSEQVTEPQV